MSQSGSKFIKSMSLINHLPQKLSYQFQNRSILKVISGLNNFDSNSVAMIARAGSQGGADLIDIACDPRLVELVKDLSSLSICVSSIYPKLFVESVSAGAGLIEIGNYDVFYEQGMNFSANDVLSMAKESKDLLPNIPLSATIPHTLPLDQQVDLAMKLVNQGVDIIQTEGGKSSKPFSPGVQGFFEKATPTLAATYMISQEFIRNNISVQIMSASGLSQSTCPLAIACGASAVGVGSVVNKLDNLVSMIAAVRGLKESLQNSIIKEKFLNI